MRSFGAIADKASVIFWSVANETPVNPARNAFLQSLISTARAQDGTRLVTAAMLSSMHGNEIQVNDPLGAYLDVVSFNEYAGWYQDTPQDIAKIRIASIYQKPLLLSEFGAGAEAGFHADPLERGISGERLPPAVTMLRGVKHLRGICPWVLVDFRSPLRELPGIRDLYNRKGPISDQGQKKQAYFVMQKAYLQRTVGNAQ